MAASTRQRILDTARLLFWEKSYGATGVDLICQEARVRKGSFYHFFPSKEILAIAVLERWWQLGETTVFAASFHNTALAPKERFLRFAVKITESASTLATVTGRYCGCPLGNMTAELSTQSQEVHEKITHLIERHIHLFQSAIEEAMEEGSLPIYTPADMLARQFFVTYEGAALLAKMANKPALMREILEEAIAFWPWIEQAPVAHPTFQQSEEFRESEPA